jgi:hypothetical protein
LYYWGTNSSDIWSSGGGPPDYGNAGFGLATSTDGLTWQKQYGANPNNPMVVPEPNNAYNDFWRMRYPDVIKVGSTYLMYYQSEDRVHRATSADGVTWNKGTPDANLLGTNNPQAVYSWDSGGLERPTVVYDQYTHVYTMFYTGYDWYGSLSRVGVAASYDGVNWIKYSGNPILTPSPAGAWDSGQVNRDGSVLLYNGQLMYYYTADQDDANYNFMQLSIGLITVGEGIPLSTGWNLVSTPLVPNNNAIKSILAPAIAANELSIVWSYTGTGTTRTWQSFTPPSTGTLTTMVDGSGYWIYMKTADVLFVGGTVIPPSVNPSTYSLVPGWNLVGFKPQPSIISETVGSYLSSITGSYDSNNVWIYNANGSWTRDTGGSTSLMPGQAMWIFVTAPTGGTLKP